MISDVIVKFFPAWHFWYQCHISTLVVLKQQNRVPNEMLIHIVRFSWDELANRLSGKDLMWFVDSRNLSNEIEPKSLSISCESLVFGQ